MFGLLAAVIVYTIVFGFDYLSFLQKKASYQYVSRRTFLVFFLGQIVLLLLFWETYRAFFAHIGTELVFLAILFVILISFCHLLVKDNLLVCQTVSRSERCLTPGYVLTKGQEIMFQQLTYAAIALCLANILGVHILSYIAYMLILLIIHTPIVLSMNRESLKRFTVGILVISIPAFYTFTTLQYFYPAVYLHVLFYIVLWLTLANWDGKNTMQL